jgi:hypothetical protein
MIGEGEKRRRHGGVMYLKAKRRRERSEEVTWLSAGFKYSKDG